MMALQFSISPLSQVLENQYAFVFIVCALAPHLKKRFLQTLGIIITLYL
jgi:hypothetical protein